MGFQTGGEQFHLAGARRIVAVCRGDPAADQVLVREVQRVGVGEQRQQAAAVRGVVEEGGCPARRRARGTGGGARRT